MIINIINQPCWNSQETTCKSVTFFRYSRAGNKNKRSFLLLTWIIHQ